MKWSLTTVLWIRPRLASPSFNCGPHFSALLVFHKFFQLLYVFSPLPTSIHLFSPRRTFSQLFSPPPNPPHPLLVHINSSHFLWFVSPPLSFSQGHFTLTLFYTEIFTQTHFLHIFFLHKINLTHIFVYTRMFSQRHILHTDDFNTETCTRGQNQFLHWGCF